MEIDKKNPSARRTQKKQGFFEILRLKLIKLSASEIIGADIRTSEGDDRIELSRKNQLGFPSEGLYLYSNDYIATSFNQNTIFFYDNTGTLKAAIQMPTAGNLGIAGDQVQLNANSGGHSITVNSSGVFLNLPTSDPSVSGALWNDAGTVKVST